MSDLSSEADAKFIRNMKAAREIRGWSQAQLADALVEAGVESMNQSAVSRLEKGERDVRLGEARIIAKLFGTNVDALSTADEGDFAQFLGWVALTGKLVDANKALRDAIATYERLRQELRRYLAAPPIPLADATAAPWRTYARYNAIDIATEGMVELYPGEKVDDA